MPPDAGIAQQSRRKDPARHGHQQNDEDQFSDGRNKKPKPCRRRCCLRRPGVILVGTSFNLRVLRIQSMLAPNRHVTRCRRERPAPAGEGKLQSPEGPNKQSKAKRYLPGLPASTASLSNLLSAGTCFRFDRNHFWKDSI